MQSYVNHLGRWLSLQSSKPSLPWTFVVVDEADFQAFSVPGGYVFVSRGLVDRCADEAELAGLIAHEIAHVAQRHGLKAMQKIAAIDSAEAASLANLTHRVQRNGAGVTAEFEADRLAVAMVARAGLDPFGLMAALVQQNTLNDSDLHYAEAHPQSRLRLDQLEVAMAHMGQLSGQAAVPVHVPQRLAAFVSR
jgi:predicted Zn-dependent protease